MKKIMTALLAVAMLSSTALAADKETTDAAKAAREKQFVEETHSRPAKKAKKAKKAKADKAAPAAAPAAPAPAK